MPSKKEIIDERLRIKDIAALAKVSPGTVDRVIHNRGGVAPESKKRIEKILSEMNFKPNKMAQLLAIKKDYKLTCLLPESQAGDYWWDILKGIKRAQEEVADYRVKVEVIYFNQYNVNSFEEAAHEMLDKNPDGALLAPFFRREVLRLTKDMEERSIPFVFVDSNVDGVNSLAYYGQQSHQSGYLAAKMLMGNIDKDSTVLLLHMLRGGSTGANQTVKREEGFLSYIEKYSLESQYKIMRVDIHAENADNNYAMLDDLFAKNPNIHGAITFNSRVYRFAEYIESRKIKNVRILGYDLLERNVRYLKNGIVECLIGQRPQLQGYYGLMALVKHIVLSQNTKQVSFMPIDILIKENINDYKVYPFDI